MNIKSITYNIKYTYLRLKVLIESFLYIERNRFDNYQYKWRRLNNLIQKYHPQIFIETGTYYGLTTKKMIGKFDKIISIEINNELYAFNKIKFQKNKNIEIINGDSSNLLFSSLESLSNIQFETILFWLDGHCSEKETGIGEEYSPIERELNQIFSFQDKFNLIIVIDDLRLFDGVNYPSFSRLLKIIDQSKFEVLIDSDAIVLKSTKI